jgi:dTDP-glucose 4,6-dehydratase
MSKKILITGGAGFIAHHIIDTILLETDWEIVTIDRLDYSGNLNRLNEIVNSYPKTEQKRVKMIYHDLKSFLNPQIVKAIGPVNYIAHLAAGSHVDRSIEYPMEFVMDNVVGTVNILDFSRTVDSLERFVYFSTDEIFGPALNGMKFKEYDRYNSTNPYSASKAAGEEMVVSYENTYNLPAIITHTMNVFGERQHPEKYIPMCIKRIRDNEKIIVHSNKEKTKAGSRHYIHAKDVADALLFLLNFDLNKVPFDENAGRCHKFNIVGSKELDNLQVAEFVANVQNKKLIYEFQDFHSTRPGHDLRYALDGTKMKTMGWQPKPIDDRLTNLIEWSLNNDRWL